LPAIRRVILRISSSLFLLSYQLWASAGTLLR